MEIRAIAEFYDLEKVRQDCDKLLRGMRLETLSETVQFENVEKDKVQHFLTQRIKVLEGYLEKLYPQFIGLLECCLWWWHERNYRRLQECPTHFNSGKAKTNLDECIKERKSCQEMLDDLASYTIPFDSYFGDMDFINTYSNSVYKRYRFEKCLPNVIQTPR